jgi:hypothetical protein
MWGMDASFWGSRESGAMNGKHSAQAKNKLLLDTTPPGE